MSLWTITPLIQQRASRGIQSKAKHESDMSSFKREKRSARRHSTEAQKNRYGHPTYNEQYHDLITLEKDIYERLGDHKGIIKYLGIADMKTGAIRLASLQGPCWDRRQCDKVRRRIQKGIA